MADAHTTWKQKAFKVQSIFNLIKFIKGCQDKGRLFLSMGKVKMKTKPINFVLKCIGL